MRMKNVKSGSVGVNCNAVKNAVLLQCNDEDSQTRIVLAKHDVELLIVNLNMDKSALQDCSPVV